MSARACEISAQGADLGWALASKNENSGIESVFRDDCASAVPGCAGRRPTRGRTAVQPKKWAVGHPATGWSFRGNAAFLRSSSVKTVADTTLIRASAEAGAELQGVRSIREARPEAGKALSSILHRGLDSSHGQSILRPLSVRAAVEFNEVALVSKPIQNGVRVVLVADVRVPVAELALAGDDQ